MVTPLFMPIFLRQVTLAWIKGLPFIRVLKITFNCHKIYAQEIPEANNIALMKIVFAPTIPKYWNSQDEENGTKIQQIIATINKISMQILVI